MKKRQAYMTHIQHKSQKKHKESKVVRNTVNREIKIKSYY